MYFYLFTMLIMFTILLTITVYIKSLDIFGFCLHCKSMLFSLRLLVYEAIVFQGSFPH